jgi:hypothetical protein
MLVEPCDRNSLLRVRPSLLRVWVATRYMWWTYEAGCAIFPPFPADGPCA